MEEANDGVAPRLVLQSVAARHRPEGRVAAPLCRQLFAAAWLDRRPTVTAARSFVGGREQKNNPRGVEAYSIMLTYLSWMFDAALRTAGARS